MRAVEEFSARGHFNITATHSSTLEITKRDDLTKNGDCIVAVGATKSLPELSERFRKLCALDMSRIQLEISAGGIIDVVSGKGNSMLTFNHLEDIVIRRSSHISDRTLMIAADKAARDLNRKLVRSLCSPDTSVTLRLIVQV
ncbi:MAG TPA: DUF371 domain-containing protein [Candidatus Saccharimonadales bacterium]|nr:DUF371 domain-containing protein [Candidatus Saccharimonadales bacterium]